MRVVVYSHDADTRARVRLAIGRRPAPDRQGAHCRASDHAADSSADSPHPSWYLSSGGPRFLLRGRSYPESIDDVPAADRALVSAALSLWFSPKGE